MCSKRHRRIRKNVKKYGKGTPDVVILTVLSKNRTKKDRTEDIREHKFQTYNVKTKKFDDYVP